MRSNHALAVGMYFVLASFGIGTAGAADCLVAATDGISNAFARGQLDAAAQKTFYEEKLWGRNPLERAAEGKFAGQAGVTGDEIYGNIPLSLLNRDALSKISFTDPKNQPSVGQVVSPGYGRVIKFGPFAILRVKPADPTNLALDLSSELFKSDITTPAIRIVPDFPMQRIELEPPYTIAIKARPSC
jgi:hypothetical protein